MTRLEITGTKGRDSKYSSKVYVLKAVEVEERPGDKDLEAWFGSVDAVARRREYEAQSRGSRARE